MAGRFLSPQNRLSSIIRSALIITNPRNSAAMKPSSKYREFLQSSEFQQDSVQQHAISLFDHLQDKILSDQQAAPQRSLLGSLLSSIKPGSKPSRPPVEGLYLWGGVGRGKTFMMDIFFETLPIADKKRVHFHRFMKFIHDELKHSKMAEDPLSDIAREYARNVRVLCLDEFVVTDIGDAMLIGRLLKALFDQRVTLVTTSNTTPEGLYKDGLQRANFLPAIALLNQHCEVFNLDGGQDYRTLGLKQAELYQCPHSDEAVEFLRHYLDTHLLMSKQNDSLEVNGRLIPYEYCAEDTIWFSYEELCKTARSRLDYLEIAQDFGTLVLSGIEQMDDKTNDAARRFVSLIDVLYDHRVKLICTAMVPVEELYLEGKLSFEFQRTVSRLLEMQSQEYMGQSHKIY